MDAQTMIVLVLVLVLVFFMVLIGTLTFVINRRYYRQGLQTSLEMVSALKAEKQQLQTQLMDEQNQVKSLLSAKAALESGHTLQSQQILKDRETIETLHNKLNQASKDTTILKGDIREQQVKLNAEKDKLKELKHQFEQQKTDLKNQFKLVSKEIIKEGQQTLNAQNKESVGTLIEPLQKKIDDFQKRVNEVHTETIKGNTSLEKEISKVMQIGLKMSDEATNLTSALKGSSQQRGAWGEAQLERTLEMSGLIENTHYEKQASFRDQNGDHKRTDYLIKLPGKKHIVIDSKVSLLAYDRAVSAETELDQKQAMKEHVKSVKNHIDDLASKDYINLIGVHSPGFILLFMPIEPSFIEALKYNKDLFTYGFDKNIVLVSHTTLIPILRTVANLWMLEQSNSEAREISQKAGDVYNSVCIVANRLKGLGTTLNAAKNKYNDCVTAITGHQGLHGKVERFTQLSNKVSKQMPVLESVHFEYETHSLDMQPSTISIVSEEDK